MIMKQIRIYFMLLCFTLLAHEALANNDGMPVLRITIPNKTLSETYVSGEMSLTDTDGSMVELHAKFKTRGATAKGYSMKPSFNMKLQNADGVELDSTLLGLRSMSSWILDAMAIDRICMRNRVAFDTWNDFSSLPYSTNYDSRNGTIGRFVEVYINNVYKGIYCLTDRINRKLLNLKKPQVAVTAEGAEEVTIRGVIYKHGTNDIGNQNQKGFSEDSVAYVIAYHDAWELAEPEEYAGQQAWTPLETIYANKNDFQWVKDNFYLEQLADYQIFIMTMSISDNWGNKNSYISARNVTADDEKHKFVYTPWDLDTSLGGSYNGTYYDGNYSDWKPANIVSASTMPVPFAICNRQSEYKEMLKNSWLKGRSGAFSYDAMKARMYKYRDEFINSGAWARSLEYWETQKYKPCYVTDLTKEIDLILEWYNNRISSMNAYFNLPADDGIELITTQDNSANAIYSLQGTRLATPRHKGIFIQNGKKYINK